MKKIVCFGVMLVMCMSAGLFSGCESGSDFAINKVSITIKTEFREKFLAEEFTVEDFEWDNVNELEYGRWYDNIAEPRGSMVVYLKKQGKKQVLAAVKHFKTLEFVYFAGVDGTQQGD